MSKDLIVKPKEEIIVSENPDRLISLALERGAEPQVLSRLMDLQERWEANQAKKAYVEAMTAFKQEAPAVLIKTDSANFGSGKAAYRYANLGSIVQEISALLGKYQLSASWQTAQTDKGQVSVTCHITHIGGHRESVLLVAPPDTTGNKNQIQAIGSTVTYLQRYTLLAALGLATGEDDDGPGGEREPIKQPQTTKKGDTKGGGEAIASDAQVNAMYAMYAKMGIKDREEVKAQVSDFLGLESIEHLHNLTKKEASSVIEMLNKELQN